MNTESEMVFQTSMFQREHDNLEAFFDTQINNYMRELDNMAAQIQQKTSREFNPADWTFNPNNREWTSKTGILKIQLEKGELGTQTVLKDKITAFFVRSSMPNEKAILSQI